MAEAFLNQLPRVGRGILQKEDQRCFNCMEDYGTMPSANGIIERAVKLPCNHIMGSECISLWVSSPAQGGSGNNTCPVCRHVLFENESPIDDESPPTAPSPFNDEHRRIHNVLTRRTMRICSLLELDDPHVCLFADWTANTLHDRTGLLEYESSDRRDRLARAVAAASVYIACEILGDARPAETIARCDSSVGLPGMAQAYTLLYNHRYEVIGPQLAHMGIELGVDELLPFIPF